MSIVDSIITGTYSTNCGFASVNNFKDGLLKYGLNSNDPDIGIDSLKNNLKNSMQKMKDDYDNRAFIQLLIEDICQIEKTTIQEMCFSELDLNKALHKYTQLLESLNISVSPPDFFIVDCFPKPFDNTDWSAFCPDAEDEKNYNIPKGIYFLKKKIRPYYSEILLAHEMIHSLCGTHNPELYAMGLEEGIAELMGSLYLASNVLGIDVVRNNFSHTRFNKNTNLLWTLYLDHTRQAYLLYKKYGIEILIYLINSGRKTIHCIERDLFSRRGINFNFEQRTYFNDSFNNLLDYLLLAYTPNYVVSPLQKLLIREAKQGVSVISISEKLQVPASLVEDELKKIAFSTSLFMLDGNSIGYSNVELYESANSEGHYPIIRYYKEI